VSPYYEAKIEAARRRREERQRAFLAATRGYDDALRSDVARMHVRGGASGSNARSPVYTNSGGLMASADPYAAAYERARAQSPPYNTSVSTSPARYRSKVMEPSAFASRQHRTGSPDPVDSYIQRYRATLAAARAERQMSSFRR
jgi:hypothetical protein